MSFVTYKDLLICSNGYDNIFVYDGSSTNVTWELGSCKATLIEGGSNLDSGATYSYKITYDADAYVCDAVSNTVTTSAGSRKVTLSNIPLQPVGSGARKIYRTNGGGTVYYLIATEGTGAFATEAVIYTDDIADDTAIPMPAVTDDMPKGGVLQLHRERLFITRDPSYPNKIYYSNPYLPHYIQQTVNLDYMDVNPDDGDEIMGIPIQLGTMLCIKKNTIRLIHVTSAVSGADPATWYADDPISFVGSPAQWSITQTPYGVMFLGWDHWYMFNGSSTEPIMDEFDTGEILPATYYDTVGFWHKGSFLAAYTDIGAASQQHDRVMRYNMKRLALSYDTIPANCFAAKVGDDETGELYYGHSSSGYILQDENKDTLYKLNTKTQASEGTATNTFVGGTESSPYIEIGASTAASTIPDNICIFWDQVDPPGAGWVEVTDTERLIRINATAGTLAGSSAHTHSLSGSLAMSTAIDQDGGDSEGTCTDNNHTHSVSASASASTSIFPRYRDLRVFKSSGLTTTEFPDGAILMWSEATAPTGWTTYGEEGFYIRMNDSDSDFINTVSSTHVHTFNIVSDAGGDSIDSGGASDNEHHAPTNHTHNVSGTTLSATMDTWELEYVSFRLIKKIGESDTWDGVNKYVYALFDAASAVSNGWTDMTTTYSNRFLKIGVSTPSTGAAANGSHTHSISDGLSEYHNGNGPVYGGYHHQMIERHLHAYTLTAASTSVTAAPYRTFRLFRKVLGKMKAYNAAIETTYTSGTWTSPSLEINSLSLDKMYWNETLTGTDDVLIYTRTGTTKALCEAAAWSATGLTDPNGSTITSTASTWLQYKIEFTATDTVVSNPKVYMTSGFALKFLYTRGATVFESSVEFIYSIGYRNFNAPFIDKLFKNIIVQHEGSNGSFKVQWETENASNEFVVDLLTYPSSWNSYFHDTALGKKMNLTFYKNDNYSFKVKEVQGLYSPQPVII
jgi:hypothetical protein